MYNRAIGALLYRATLIAAIDGVTAVIIAYITKYLSNKPFMAEAVKYGGGIRILNSDPWEMIISFIISANNHIPRIKGIIERLCKGLGKDIIQVSTGNTSSL